MKSFDALAEQHESALKAIGSPFGWGTLAIDSAREELTAVISQRDQLLEALEALLEADQAIERASDLLPGDRSRNRFNAMMQARAAIAKAKGGTL